MKKYIIPGIILAIVAFLALNAWSTYNSFVTIDQDVEAQWGKVQVQYQREWTLFPTLCAPCRAMPRMKARHTRM